MMKTMTCKQLGGACNEKFQADSFKEIAELSKQHGTEMFQKKDAAHLKAMAEMGELMKESEKMQSWFESKKEEFESLPQDAE
jgi:hypothetical protein